jgi:hypothetical protein
MQAGQPFIPSPEEENQRTIDWKFLESMGLNHYQLGINLCVESTDQMIVRLKSLHH